MTTLPLTKRQAPRILLVDDHDLVRDLASAILTPAGYGVDAACNGAEAVAAVKDRRYDLVLMDLNMPVMDGYDASRAIRAMEADPGKLPVVAMTASFGSEASERRRMAGINALLAKPFVAKDLLALVRLWTETPAGRPATKAIVWDEAAYRDLAEGLGSAQVASVLDLFEQHVTHILATIGTAPIEDQALIREAHDIVSCAGMLGFDALSRASAAIMAPPRGEEWAERVAALRAAAEDVLACLAGQTGRGEAPSSGLG